MKKWLRENEKVLCLIVTFTLILLRFLLTSSLPLHVRPGYKTDDALLMEMAVALLDGKWLGAYSAVKLMKGCFFALFLAGLHTLGLSYLAGLTILYSLACLFFSSQLKPLLNSGYSRLILFGVLLFNPSSYACLTFQRVYRNSLTASQVLLITGAYIGIYLKLRFSEGALSMLTSTAVSIMAGFTFWGFINTREDALWLYPFVITASFLIILIGVVHPLRIRRENLIRYSAPGLLFVLVPCLITIAGNRWIKSQNNKYYMSPVRLEVSDGSFPAALEAIYSVRNEYEVPCVTVTREKLERLYAVSPALRSIRSELDEQLDYYMTVDRNHDDSEVEDGWFFWALRRGAYNAGKADTAPKAEAYYAQVESEIRSALLSDNAVLVPQKTMPSALISPWRNEYGKLLLKTMLHAIKYMICFQDVEVSAEESFPGSRDKVRVFEAVTGNLAIYRADKDHNDQYHADVTKPYVDRLNRIAKMYRGLNPLIAIMVVAVLPILLFRHFRNRKSYSCSSGRLPTFLLITSSLLLSLAVMIGGVAYTDISAFAAVRYFYLTGGYPLLLSAEWLVILYCFQEFFPPVSKS